MVTELSNGATDSPRGSLKDALMRIDSCADEILHQLTKPGTSRDPVKAMEDVLARCQAVKVKTEQIKVQSSHWRLYV
jgi:hypothetical protein